jgi:hypothetical protein
MCLLNRIVSFCCVLLCLNGDVFAQTDSQVSERPESESGTPNAGLWLIGLLAQADDESSRGAAASFGYGVGESTWLSGLITSSSSPAERADISANSFAFGVDHRFEHIGLSLELEDWGDSGAVESEDITAGISFFGDRFAVELGLEQRAIDITFGLPLGDRVITRKVPLDADGWSLGIMLRASEAVRIYYDYRDYDYSRDLTVLPRIQELNLLNGSALTLANSFLRDIHTVAVDVTFGNKALSLTWGEDTSAVDGTELTSFGAALILPVAARVDLEISVGTSHSEFLDSSTYAGLGILVYGGG